MALVIHADGREIEVRPHDQDKGFNLGEMYQLIGCDTIDIVRLVDGRRMIVDDNGAIANPPKAVNEKATVLYQEGRNTAWAIRGTVLVGTEREIE